MNYLLWSVLAMGIAGLIGVILMARDRDDFSLGAVLGLVWMVVNASLALVHLAK